MSFGSTSHCPTCGKPVSPLAAQCPFDGTALAPPDDGYPSEGYTVVTPRLGDGEDGRTDPALRSAERARNSSLASSGEERTDSFSALSFSRSQEKTELVPAVPVPEISQDRTSPLPFVWEPDPEERTQQVAAWPSSTSVAPIQELPTQPLVPVAPVRRAASIPNLPAVIVDSALYADLPTPAVASPNRRSLRTMAIIAGVGAAAMLLIGYVALGFGKEKPLKPIGPAAGRSRVVSDLAVMATPSQGTARDTAAEEGIVEVRRIFEARINALDRKRRSSEPANPEADKTVRRLLVDLRTLSIEGVPAFSKRMDQFETHFVPGF
ncbi:MAG: hypothetical protein ACT4TC_17805 [Myxococcaceae bacterium]